MTEQELQAIKERVENASVGPWKVVKSEESGTQIGTTWEHGQLGACLPVVTTAHSIKGVTVYINDVNAEFIAHAREDVPALVAEIERLWNTSIFEALSEINRLRKALEFYANKEHFITFDSPAIKDSGEIARKALEESE